VIQDSASDKRSHKGSWSAGTITVETAMSKLLNKDNKANALYQRAEECWTEGKLSDAFKLFLAAAKAGFVPAYSILASFYDQGTGVKTNRRKALSWYMRAYRQHDSWYRRGDTTFANNIGCIWRDKRKPRTAIMWFKRAVRLGDGDANLNIALIYLHSNRERQKAVRYLQRTIDAKYVTDGSIEEARKLLSEIRRTKRKIVLRSR
jgi:TPR repeat protein